MIPCDSDPYKMGFKLLKVIYKIRCFYSSLYVEWEKEQCLSNVHNAYLTYQHCAPRKFNLLRNILSNRFAPAEATIDLQKTMVFDLI